MNTTESKLKSKRKVIILFVEYFLFAAFNQIFYKLICLLLNKERFYPWYFMLFSFFVYYSLCEFKFNKTLGMQIFKVELDIPNVKKTNLNFIIYSIASIIDRTLFLPIHMLLAILNYENLLLCEKLSGIKWKRII